MWIKSLDSDVWVNMNHVTHFDITQMPAPHLANYHANYTVQAYLDASKMAFTAHMHRVTQNQASLIVKRGTYEECEQFIKEQLFLQSAWQWVGYLVAGGVGAILTLIFS